MHIAILTFDGFNELDSLVALGILSRVKRPGWRVSIACPTPRVRSMNGVQSGPRSVRNASARVSDTSSSGTMLKAVLKRAMVGQNCRVASAGSVSESLQGRASGAARCSVPSIVVQPIANWCGSSSCTFR